MASNPITALAPVDTPRLAGAEPVALSENSHGYVDVFGYSMAAAGWLFCGWVPRPDRIGQVDYADFTAQFDQTVLDGKATIAFYRRDDLDRRGVGVVAFMPGSSRVAGNLQHIALQLGGGSYRAIKAPTARLARDQDLVDSVRVHLLNQAFANPGRDKLLSITLRAGFTGHDTLASLGETVLVGIDEAIPCPPHGVLLLGWQLSAPGAVRAWRVRCGHLSGEFSIADSILIPRPDVISAVESEVGFSDPRCGFIAYAANAVSRNDAPYLEVELENGEVGFKPLKLSQRSGMSAIRRVLEAVDLRYTQLAPAFDHVLGPAIAALNKARLAATPAPVEVGFGQPPPAPRYSLIVPLYGRIDFVEYQMALLSRHGDTRSFDILYVLDDPGRRRDLEVLAQSVFERFRIPFRLLLLDSNLGFAPANNIGLRHARGHYVCFLNSDVFPITPDWLERLVQRIEHNPGIGVIGPRLLFEDGSVQHEGCFFRALPEFGNWSFVDHLNKGRRPRAGGGLQRCDVITGACMVMRRTLAEDLGGFDEAFIIGDFEDSDLCLKLQQRTLECAVDRDVEMYHLERKSQASPEQRWRMNVTLYNAWVHQRRWFSPNGAKLQAPRNYRLEEVADGANDLGAQPDAA